MDNGFRCRFDEETEMTREQMQKFRDQFVKDCQKRDDRIRRNILTVIGAAVIIWLSVLCEDITVAIVIVPLLVASLFVEEE
jgi:hypothetical protein